MKIDDTIAGFDPYVRDFIDQVAEHGYDDTRCAWKVGYACGCMGPQNGEPFCPCDMRSRTVKIMDFLLTEVVNDRGGEA